VRIGIFRISLVPHPMLVFGGSEVGPASYFFLVLSHDLGLVLALGWVVLLFGSRFARYRRSQSCRALGFSIRRDEKLFSLE